MRPEERDAALLWDMLDASRAVRDFTAGVTFEAYVADRRLQFAVERGLEILGKPHVTCRTASAPRIRESRGVVLSANGMCLRMSTARSTRSAYGGLRRRAFLS